MDNDIKQNLSKVDYYLRLALKKRWLIIIPFCLAMIVGSALTIILPKTYSAINLILVVPKSVPDKYVPDVLTTDVQQRINTIKQQIMSRTNLEKIIKTLNLFSDPKYEHMFFIDKIEHIRKNTSINVTKNQRGINSFTIEYEGTNPEQVMKIVNTLADLFITESVKVIESEVNETNVFLSGELSGLRKRLEEIEKKINAYRKKYMGELPEELRTNLSTLSMLNEQLRAGQAGIRDAKNRVAVIEDRISMERTNIASINAAQSQMAALYANAKQPVRQMPAAVNEPAEIDQLRAVLKELQSRYTKSHPDIIRIKSAIAALEESSTEIPPPQETPENGTPSKVKVPTQIPNGKNSIADKRLLFDLSLQREAALREIKEGEAKLKEIEKEIEKYQQRVENTPKRDQELIAMRRNYANLQRSYNKLLDRKLESDIAVNMERKQKGQKFRVIDTATLPQKPISPNTKLIFIAVLGIGLGSGIGLIFLLDLIDLSVKSPEEVQKKSGIPTIALIPEIYTDRQKFRNKVNRFFSYLGGVAALGVFLIFSVLSFYDLGRIIGLINKHVRPLIGF